MNYDFVMPGMSGRELVEEIGKLSPATRIICTSGYVWPASKIEDERPIFKSRSRARSCW